MDAKFFMVAHVDTPKDLQSMLVLSVESFLRHNEVPLHLIVATCYKDQVMPDFANLLSRKYPGRVVANLVFFSDMDFEDKLTKYSFRFYNEVAHFLGGGKMVYMDFDLYHMAPMVPVLEEFVDWEKVNACLDLAGYIGNPRILRQHNEGKSPYINTGLLAWDDSVTFSNIFRKEVVTKAQSLVLYKYYDKESYPFFDQDIANEILAAAPTWMVNILPESLNHFIRGVAEHCPILPIGIGAKSIGVKVLHVASYQGSGRLQFFKDMAESEGWLQDSAVHYMGRTGKDISVVVISHNQAQAIPAMKAFLDKNFSGCPVLMVLDRCVDESVAVATACGMPFIENREGEGFLAGRMRDIGRERLGIDGDALFLDGDRIPSPLFTYEAACKALSLFDLTVLPVQEGEFRKWFHPTSFSVNPKYGEWVNDVFTCGVLVRGSALKSLVDSQKGYLFVPDFDGQFGEEDQYLGDVAFKLGLTCGGAPLAMALSGGFRPHKERGGFERNVAIRNQLRTILGYPPKFAPSEVTRTLLRNKIRGGGGHGG